MVASVRCNAYSCWETRSRAFACAPGEFIFWVLGSANSFARLAYSPPSRDWLNDVCGGYHAVRVVVMRVLVTGAHGYLGSAIFHAFAGLHRTALVSPWGDTAFIADTDAAIVRADIREPGDLEGVFTGQDVVV